MSRMGESKSAQLDREPAFRPTLEDSKEPDQPYSADETCNGMAGGDPAGWWL